MFEWAEGLLVGPPAVRPIVLDRVAVPKAGKERAEGREAANAAEWLAERLGFEADAVRYTI